MKIAIRFMLPILSALLLVLASSQPRRSSVLAQDQSVQVVEVTAKKYEFSPSPIRVKAGSQVQLKITAIDHDHGFAVDPVPQGALAGGKPGLIFASPAECVQLKKGQTTVVEFLAQAPGTYAFHCCHTCGLGHRHMKSEIVVE